MYWYFSFCIIVGILSSKYLHKWHPFFDFILNWWLKVTTYCFLHSLYKMQYCLSSFIYFIWYSILLPVSYSINCCNSENKTHPNSNQLCAKQLWPHSHFQLFTSLQFVLKERLRFFNNSILSIKPLHKLWLILHLFMTLLALWSIFKHF